MHFPFSFALLFVSSFVLLTAAPTASSAAVTPRTTLDTQTQHLSPAQAKALFHQAELRGLPAAGLLLVIDTPGQRAILLCSAGALCSYTISTALAGTGNRSGSLRTPLGWHQVQERFGDKAAPGTVFVSRKANGRILPQSQWSSPSPAEDLVLTRILWLTGLEPGVNAGANIDSHERCIYLHGTNQEQLLGKPASHGCIRFSNSDIVHLFEFTEGAVVYCLIR